MKALELTIYPKPRYALTTWQYQADPSKRFTDAELAAENYRAKWTGLLHESKFHSVLSDEHRAMIATVERFAMLPHYDECPPRTEGDKPHCPDCSGIVGETGVVW